MHLGAICHLSEEDIDKCSTLLHELGRVLHYPMAELKVLHIRTLHRI